MYELELAFSFVFEIPLDGRYALLSFPSGSPVQPGPLQMQLRLDVHVLSCCFLAPLDRQTESVRVHPEKALRTWWIAVAIILFIRRELSLAEELKTAEVKQLQQSNCR